MGPQWSRSIFMEKKTDINEYIRALKGSDRLGRQVVYHTVLPGKTADFAEPEKPFPENIQAMIQNLGIGRLYEHQTRALDRVRSGSHVAVATPTASGKSLVYNLSVLETLSADSNSKALYVFPLKALAQDQLRHFRWLAAKFQGRPPTARIYDGDTPARLRKRIREAPPNILLTNPEMIHLSILPYHHQWAAFLKRLQIVVVDEIHVYRGILGAHIAQVFRRLRRICAFYGVSPTFVFCSATVGNPGQHAEQLTGLTVKPVIRSGAPQGRRHIVFLNPPEGPIQPAIQLLIAALHRGLKTIVFTQSRKLAELITVWTRRRAEKFANKVSVYRAGLMPRERRDIEAGLATGELLGVISTSALELGIDIGDLDLCILVGYPGSLVATWQRGGRVGRNGKDSALILIAGEDALDQYVIRNPAEFVRTAPEAVVVNPYNREVLSRHLICAAAELPLENPEPMMRHQPVMAEVVSLTRAGELLAGREGDTYYSARRFPHRDVDLRGIGNRFRIIDEQTGRIIGEIDHFRAFKETHPGAVYLHRGVSHVVKSLDTETRTVKVSESVVDYYTRTRSFETTDIIEIIEEKHVLNTHMYFGKISVTEQVTGYEVWRIRDHRRVDMIDLDLPPLVFETEGLWFTVPVGIQGRTESEPFDWLGGIHAIEHAAIGILPLLVLADRNDLGGLSTLYHPQVGGAAVFVYDGILGGAGLSLQAFHQGDDLIKKTLDVIENCPCRSGCPSCVHSPKCGSGNRPMDKNGARFILHRLVDPAGHEPVGYLKKQRPQIASSRARPLNCGAKPNRVRHFGVFDIETQRSAREVGGWHRADRMKISCAVVYDSRTDAYREYMEDQVPRLVRHLEQLDLVVGFNVKRFDYQVLSGYNGFDATKVATLDILEHVYRYLGFRLSLNHLAKVTLGMEKSADGLQALKWWKEGRIREIVTYCRKDVEITLRLFSFGKKNGYLLFENKAGKIARIPVDWSFYPK